MKNSMRSSDFSHRNNRSGELQPQEELLSLQSQAGTDSTINSGEFEKLNL